MSFTSKGENLKRNEPQVGSPTMGGMNMRIGQVTSKMSTLAPSAACAVTAIVFAAVLDSRLLQGGVSALRLLLISNVLVGLLIGFLALQLQLEQKRKYKLLEERVEALSDVSQHVRSVLAALTFYGSQTGNPYSAQIVSKSLGRIESNLGQLFTRLLFGDPMPESMLKKVKAIAVSLLNAKPRPIEVCGREL